MTADPRPIAALAGALIAGGAFTLGVALFGTTEPAVPRQPTAILHAARRRLVAARRPGHGGQSDANALPSTQLRSLAAVAAGLAGWLVSGWPVAAVVAGAAVFGLPPLLAGPKTATRRIDQLEALEEWTRRLADVLTIGVGLEQAITASLRTAPPAITPQVAALSARLGARWNTETALHAFADDLDDPTGDLVAAALLLGSRRRGPGLSAVLAGLAVTVADEVTMRRKVEADRAKPRTTARWVTLITLAVIALAALNGTYIRPYGTPLGQLVLAALSLAFAAALWWMHAISAGTAEPRFLPASNGFTNPDPASDAGGFRETAVGRTASTRAAGESR